MNTLRIFFVCVLALVLPVNTVLAQMPAHEKIARAHTEHQSHLHTSAVSASADAEQVHIHQGLFGQESAHVHEPTVATAGDCVKACQAMTGSILFDDRISMPFPLTAIQVEASEAAMCGVTLAPLEDPPKLRA